MTTPASPEPVERCECGLVPYSPAITGLDAFSCCFARDGNTVARLNCAERTITRLRAELASVRALSAHNEEAARLLRTVPDSVTIGLNGGAEWPAHCAWILADEALRKDCVPCVDNFGCAYLGCPDCRIVPEPVRK